MKLYSIVAFLAMLFAHTTAIAEMHGDYWKYYFLDYIPKKTLNPKFLLNLSDFPVDFGVELKERYEGSQIWIWHGGKVVEGEIREIRESSESKHRGGLVIAASTKTPLGEGYAVLGVKPFPEQTWKAELSRRVVFNVPAVVVLSTTNQGRIRILQSDAGDHGEFVNIETKIFRKQDDSWVKIASFVGHGVVPFLDLNGDGVPELVGSTDYKSWLLRSFFPDMRTLLLNSSGV